MPMKNPPHVGETVLEDCLKPSGVTITAAARRMGIRHATLSDLCRCRTSLSPGMALRLEREFGVSADLLMGLQAAYDLAQARLKAEARGGQ